MENKVLAVVAGKEITKKDIDEVLKTLDKQAAAYYKGEQGEKQLLEELINQELLYNDALLQGLYNDKEYIEEVEKTKNVLLKRHAINKLMANIEVTDAEALDCYNKNIEAFMGEESVRASHILVDDEAFAKDILKELKNGMSFEEAASKHSKCPSKDVGGDLGYFPRGRMVPEFETAVFQMNAGDISEPVKSQFGYHIIKVTDKKAAEPIPFEMAQYQIKRQLLQEKQNEAYYKKVEELKSIYTVEVME